MTYRVQPPPPIPEGPPPRPDAKYICTLPDWWDERGQWTVFKGDRIIIAHPDHPVMEWIDGKWEKV